MQFISINYSLNQKYHVSLHAFEQILENILKNQKDIKVNNFEVKFDNNISNVLYLINFDIKKNTSIEKTLLLIQTELEEATYELINVKPKNIQLIINNRFD